MLIYVYCWVVLALHVFASICSAGPRFHRIAYIHVATDDWAQYQQLFDGTYTHLITAFLVPDSTGQLLAVDAAQVVSPAPDSQSPGSRDTCARRYRRGLRQVQEIYLDIARNPSVRQRFIQNVIRFVYERGYDGVDFNFEGWFEGLTPAQRDEGNGLMRELARAVKSRSASSHVTVPLAPLYWLPKEQIVYSSIHLGSIWPII